MIVFALGSKFVVGVFFEFINFHVALVSLLFELFLEEEERFVHLAHILFLTGNPSFFFFVDGFSSV